MQPLVVPIDDTLAKRRGRKVFGCFWHHDATANSNKGSVAWGNNWVTAGINVKLPFLERTVCLLVLFRLWRPRRKEIPKATSPTPSGPRNPGWQGRCCACSPQRFPGRKIHMVGDAAYASGAFAGLPEQRHDHLPAARRRRARTSWRRPARRRASASKAARRRRARGCPSSAQIATDPSHQWVKTTVRRYGKTEQVMVHAFRCLWYEAFGAQPVQVVIIQDAEQALRLRAGADLHRPRSHPRADVERYADRWPTEVAYEEGKEHFGVGDARNRTEKAVSEPSRSSSWR